MRSSMPPASLDRCGGGRGANSISATVESEACPVLHMPS